MSALRVTTASAARMLRTNAMTPRASVMGRRAASSGTDDSAVRSAEAARVPEKLPKEDSPMNTPKRNSPNYDVPIDIATSTWTPVPKNIQNGSEQGILPAAVVSGAPMELQARTVRIFLPSKPATQSSNSRVLWRMDWDVLEKGHRWENQLMGWQSSGDFVQGTHLNFRTKEEAIAFAEKQGYEYFVQEPNQRHFTPKAYANNFLYSPKKLKVVRTK
ncbi:ETC complex I subunit conserved region-domain-containing protein [Pseudoneurospora amorphoporcata]|uniref:NADH dehydrogenase [ubiquinone] iron-sulfur protein 4, mitochondrial n=1 Tax=Pseudoneurospora amorphoporcata TaxID=241081 RepID=A0AAN6NRX9_9PEZI|nr:ETC complex I subunit conserved region-domain-containing protein [Pseudoneurospora amorphoporcata]